MTTTKLSDELARATEAAASAVFAHIGGHDMEAIDRAAVEAMRQVLKLGHLQGRIAIGEGEKDNAPMLHNGEVVGRPGSALVDLAVDPIDGTRAAAMGKPGSVSALAAAPADRMFQPGSVAYMEKLVAPPGVDLHLDMPTEELLAAVAQSRSIPLEALQVAILDRPRNRVRMQEVRTAGAQLVALPYADLSASIAVATGTSPLGLLIGIGGCAEGVIAAVAASALGATLQCRLWPRDERERVRAEEDGLSCSSILDAESMVGTEGLGVVLTGVTGSVLVEKAGYESGSLVVHSLKIDGGHAPVFTRQQVP